MPCRAQVWPWFQLNLCNEEAVLVVFMDYQQPVEKGDRHPLVGSVSRQIYSEPGASPLFQRAARGLIELSKSCPKEVVEKAV